MPCDWKDPHYKIKMPDPRRSSPTENQTPHRRREEELAQGRDRSSGKGVFGSTWRDPAADGPDDGELRIDSLQEGHGARQSLPSNGLAFLLRALRLYRVLPPPPRQPGKTQQSGGKARAAFLHAPHGRSRDGVPRGHDVSRPGQKFAGTGGL